MLEGIAMACSWRHCRFHPPRRSRHRVPPLVAVTISRIVTATSPPTCCGNYLSDSYRNKWGDFLRRGAVSFWKASPKVLPQQVPHNFGSICAVNESYNGSTSKSCQCGSGLVAVTIRRIVTATSGGARARCGNYPTDSYRNEWGSASPLR